MTAEKSEKRQAKKPRPATVLGLAAAATLGVFLLIALPSTFGLGGAVVSNHAPAARTPSSLTLTATVACWGGNFNPNCSSYFAKQVNATVSTCFLAAPRSALCNATLSVNVSNARYSDLTVDSVASFPSTGSGVSTQFYFVNADPSLPALLVLSNMSGHQAQTAHLSLWFHLDAKATAFTGSIEFLID